MRPDVLVDARMMRRAVPERQIDLAPLTIGLGPNFIATVTTHLAVETAWGPQLGKVITSGETLPLMGEPHDTGGFGRERFVYAPADGVFDTERRIGDWVDTGQILGDLSRTAVAAPLTGFVLGLTRPGVAVTHGTNVVGIDPRKTAAGLRRIGGTPQPLAQ